MATVATTVFMDQTNLLDIDDEKHSKQKYGGFAGLLGGIEEEPQLDALVMPARQWCPCGR